MSFMHGLLARAGFETEFTLCSQDRELARRYFCMRAQIYSYTGASEDAPVHSLDNGKPGPGQG